MTSGQCISKKSLAAITAKLPLNDVRTYHHTQTIIYIALSTYLIISLALILVNPIQASVQAYQLFWWSVDGGGGNSQGNNYALTGTIGQPDAGTSQGGSYTLAGGFWSSAPSTIIPVTFETLLPFVRR